VRLLVYANSFLADPEAAAPPGTETVTAARWRRSLFAEAVAEGYTIAASTAGVAADTAGSTARRGAGTAAAAAAAAGLALERSAASKAGGGGKAPHLLESAGFKAALLDVTHPQAWPYLLLTYSSWYYSPWYYSSWLPTQYCTPTPAALTMAAPTVAAPTVAAPTVAAPTVAAPTVAGARVDDRECVARRTAHPRAGRHSK
jgi:hypothetical protein